MVNQRDLYRPDPLGGYGGSLPLRETKTTSFRNMRAISTQTEPEEPVTAPRPEFRY